MPNAYSAIQVVGGHNGLTSTAYLAKSFARVIDLESRAATCGARQTPWADLQVKGQQAVVR
jgi:hypothetical protein